jgi:AcrR family transcriptional regulator
VPPSAEPSTRRRILAATFVVLARSGRKKLMLSDVAAEAKVSRPTLYRYFPSKEALLDAFGLYEQDNFDAGISSAMAGLSGPERLDAALQFVVDFQRAYSLGFLADTEPEHVLTQMKRVIPILQTRIARLICGDDAELAAATVVRVAVCHYLIGGDDREQFLGELRHAAGISPLRVHRPATAS